MGLFFNLAVGLASYVGYKLVSFALSDDTPQPRHVYSSYGSYGHETQRIKQETPRIKQETPRIKQETPRIKQETPRIKRETPIPFVPKKPEKFKAIHSLLMYLPDVTRTIPELELTLHRMTKTWRALLQYEDIEQLMSYVDYTHYNVHFVLQNGIYTMESSKCKLADIIQLSDDIIILSNVNLVYSGGKLSDEKIINVMKSETNEYNGFIKEISNGTLQFDCKKLDCINIAYRKWTVIFRPGRYTIRYQYRALDLIDRMSIHLRQHFLFPSVNYSSCLSSPSRSYQLECSNKQIDSNLEQREAVEHIALCTDYQAPYIIFGPPGTGKTTTIVEGITKLYSCQPKSRILIMAPTNSVCNEIAVRLLHTNPNLSLLRIFSLTALRQFDSIDQLLLQTGRSNYAKEHYYPAVKDIHRNRIVVCTLSVAGKLALGDFGKGYGNEYTHIFIDEAASCTEPEILMGVASLLSWDVKLILSGDDKQLGPVLQSKSSKNTLLRVSLLERLLKRECYCVDAQGRYNRNIQIRLRNNYRSHPAIVKLYNELYYNNELRAMAKPEHIQLSQKLSQLMDSNFPIMLHASHDKSVTSEKTKSTHNLMELDIVMDYVEDLIINMKTKASDIGIITPYKDQYRLLKNRLKLKNWEDIECGAVETFQGKEKRFIIISFVRSKTFLGFLNDPERLNVMLSRPKSLLILIGNPKTLQQNKDFRYVIGACNKNRDRLSNSIALSSLKDTKVKQTANKRNINAKKRREKNLAKRNLAM